MSATNTVQCHDLSTALDLGATRPTFQYDGRLTVRIPADISPFLLRNSAVGQELIHQDVAWYDRYPWSSEPLPAGVYDIRLPVPESNRKTFDEQLKLLLPDEVPLPLVLAELALLFLRKQGADDPLRGGWVRCRETTAGGRRVALTWDDGRLYVDNLWDGYRYDRVWLGAGTFRG
jgi:hypothetical protein